MRITPLNKSFPLSYDTHVDGSYPAFANSDIYSIFSLFTSATRWMNFNPSVDINPLPFPYFLSDNESRGAASYVGNLGLSSNNSVCFGYEFPASGDNDAHVYQVSGSIHGLSLYGDKLAVSLIVGHTNNDYPNNDNLAARNIRVIQDIPIFTRFTTSNDTSVSFNFVFHDSGAPPVDHTSLWFGLCVVNHHTVTTTLNQIFLFHLNVWRMKSPLLMVNDWQA